MIKTIHVVSAQGASSYRLGEQINGAVLDSIVIAPLHFTGDPFDHYIGYDKDGQVIFTIHPSTPCVVEYFYGTRQSLTSK